MPRKGLTDAQVVIGIVAALLLVLLSVLSLTVVPAGHVGVVVSFGQVQGIQEPGLGLVAPWKHVHKLSVQTKSDTDEASVPTSEGASVLLQASLLYSLAKDHAVEIWSTVGENYEEVIVRSTFRSALREATTHYRAEDLYTAKREVIETALLKAVKDALAKRGIVAEAVLLRDMKLPKVVSDRIEAKLGAEQDSLRMVYVLKQAELEAQRKVKEAEGIAQAQAIIKKDLSHEYLIWSWIEALKTHSGSVIYVPTGTDGMPMFKQPK